MTTKDYTNKLSLFQTQKAIKKVKDYFERQMAYELNLTRVSAPLFVKPETGLNDNLNGIEQPVSFQVETKQELQIVQSLAKWKRMALYQYNVKCGNGIYTDMNAIRKDEELDATHSYYVDQWDWEKVIHGEDRNEAYLKTVVKQLYKILKMTDEYIVDEYPVLSNKLPDDVYFITSQALEDRFPNLTSKEREYAICKEYKAVFISQIGKTLRSGTSHDGRSPDYDDWDLNGDFLFYNPIIDAAFEISSMGIRVDQKALIRQLEMTNTTERLTLDYHRLITDGTLPFTIGGGIGQSRLCMFFLEKAHIGEVQSSYWPDEMVVACKKDNITLL